MLISKKVAEMQVLNDDEVLEVSGGRSCHSSTSRYREKLNDVVIVDEIVVDDQVCDP